MQIINAHAHMIEMEGMLRRYPDLVLPAGIAVLDSPEEVLPLLLPETLLAQMDDAGIDKSIIYAVEAPIVYASNEYVHSLCERFPDRLIGFASVDPKQPDAVKRLEAAVRDLGLRGLKLHPPLQDFYPNDQSVFDVYEACVELNIPVVFHVGTTPFGSQCRLAQADPLLIDDVAVRFPTLRIMLTHLGTLWHQQAFMVVEKNPNVFIDTAAYVDEIAEILTPSLVSRLGVHKIIFGTDYPMPYGHRQHQMKDFVTCLQGLQLPESQVGAIFGQNITRLLDGPRESTGGLSAREMAALLRKHQQPRTAEDS